MSKTTIHILGTTAGVPTKERAHATIYVAHDDGEEHCFLFDCGENAQRQLMIAGLGIMKVDNIFITHWHGDHSLGLPGVVDTMGFEGRDRPLKVYAPESVRVRKCLGFGHSMGKFKIIPKDVPSRGSQATSLMDERTFRIVSVPVSHSVPAVAYAIVEKEKTRIDFG